ncbi:MAG: hypothetical protein H6Q19_1072 [Bacteroidetes bacterium]|nr:hypothetical protein [Bacteroidota bacterium]
MKQTFRLRKGKISFENDEIFISDNVKTLKYILLISIVISLFSVIINISKLKQVGGENNLSFWLFILALNLLILIFLLFLSTKSSVLLVDIKSIKLKQIFKNSTLYIKLKNCQIRQVAIQAEDVDTLKAYIEKHFDGLTGK